MTTEVTVTAKPIKWEQTDDAFWADPEYGFTITEEPDCDTDSRFVAAWGDGGDMHFATFEEAEAWCQEEIDDWVKAIAVVHLQDGNSQ